jgi:hypothetical protein
VRAIVQAAAAGSSSWLSKVADNTDISTFRSSELCSESNTLPLLNQSNAFAVPVEYQSVGGDELSHASHDGLSIILNALALSRIWKIQIQMLAGNIHTNINGYFLNTHFIPS